jgi:hypothetical protein
VTRNSLKLLADKRHRNALRRHVAAARRVVRARYPDAQLEEQKTPPYDRPRQRWWIWRDRNNHQVTGDLLGCGMTQVEAWRDACERIRRC